MTILLLVLLVGLILARDGLRELPRLGESRTLGPAMSKSFSRAAPKWLRPNNHTIVRN